MRIVWLLLGLAACHRARPDATLSTPHSGSRQVLGAPLEVLVSWGAECRDLGAMWRNSMAHDSSGGGDASETKACRGKPIEVTVTCSSKCTVPAAPVSGKGALVIHVIPLELGQLTLTATDRRTDTGDTKQFVLPKLEIVAPDRLELWCSYDANDLHERTGLAYRRCSEGGVSAAEPWIEVRMAVGDMLATSTLLRINGQPPPPKHRELFPNAMDDIYPIALSDLYPDARAGGAAAIKPGTYAVTLEVGTAAQRFDVVAK